MTELSPEIANLAKLQAADVERAHLAAELKKLPAQVDEARRTLAAEQKKAAEAEASLKHEELLRRQLDVDAAAHRQKAKKLSAQLNQATTPAQVAAMEHEISFESAEADKLDERGLASLDESEKLEAKLNAARIGTAEWDEALAKTIARVDARTQEIQHQQAALATTREELRKQIPEELLQRFDRIAASRGTGLARAQDQQCLGCRMGVRPHTWNQLREGQLLNCDSCGRLLYWDPAVFSGVETAKAASR